MCIKCALTLVYSRAGGADEIARTIFDWLWRGQRPLYFPWSPLSCRCNNLTDYCWKIECSKTFPLLPPLKNKSLLFLQTYKPTQAFHKCCICRIGDSPNQTPQATFYYSPMLQYFWIRVFKKRIPINVCDCASAGIAGFSSGHKIAERILLSLAACALEADCVAPAGASPSTHRHEQSALTLAAWMHVSAVLILFEPL